MGFYGGTKVNYTPPPPDDTFSKYLSYQQAREKTLDDRAAQEKAEAAAEKSARKASGASGYAGVKATTQQQLAQGLIGYEAAANQLRDYSAKYELNAPDWGAYLNKYSDLKNTFGSDTAAAAKHYEQFGKAEGRELSPFAPVEQDITALTQQYTAALPGKRATGMSAAYEELLGRQATAGELSKGQERFQQGYYGSMEDFKSSLLNSAEYKKKFNDSYLDNYYDTKFGSSVADRTEEVTDPTTGEKKTRVTKLRQFKFDPSLLPKYSDTAGLEKKSGITQPDYETFFNKDRSVEELEQGIQGVRDARQYLYSAGLTNLQGEIDTNIQKLKKESAKEVATIGSTGNVYSNLVSSFWS
jgi:hypothetical protein